jgi:HEAT repeat protein
MKPAEPSDAITPLRQALRKRDPAVRRAALRALAALGPAAAPAIPELLERLRDADIALRTEAAGVFSRIGRAAVGPLVEALQTPDQDLRRAILVTLTELGPEAVGASPAVEPLLEDDGLGPWAVEALRSIRRPRQAGLAVVPPRVLLGAAAALLLLAAGLAAWLWVGAALRLTAPQSAVTAGLAAAFLGAGLGLVVGLRTGDGRRVMLLVTLLGLGGGMAGLLLGSLFAALVDPVVRALGH